jgi:nucleoside-diphosphate-sugar epimerase
MAKSDYQGPINPGSEEDISLGELIELIEKQIGTEAIIGEGGNPSPYNLPGSWSVNTNLVESLGFRFTSLERLLKNLILHYSKI